EMIDRFGEFQTEVELLFKISKMKVFAMNEKIESVKQVKQEITILISEEGSATIDGHKLFQLGNKYGRMISLGMEGTKLKIVIQTKGQSVDKWLQVAYEMIQGLSEIKKENVNVL